MSYPIVSYARPTALSGAYTTDYDLSKDRDAVEFPISLVLFHRPCHKGELGTHMSGGLIGVANTNALITEGFSPDTNKRVRAIAGHWAYVPPVPLLDEAGEHMAGINLYDGRNQSADDILEAFDRGAIARGMDAEEWADSATWNIYTATSKIEKWREMRDQLAYLLDLTNLNDYPLINDEEHSNLEQELIMEAYDNWIAAEIMGDVLRSLEDAGRDELAEEFALVTAEDLSDWFYRWCSDHDTYPETDGDDGDVWIDTDPIVADLYEYIIEHGGTPWKVAAEAAEIAARDTTIPLFAEAV